MANVTVRIEKAVTPKQKAGLKQLRRMQLDLRWIFANEEKLRSKYLNKLVAVKNRKVAFAGDNPVELYATIRTAGEDINDFVYEYIRKEPACLLFRKTCLADNRRLGSI